MYPRERVKLRDLSDSDDAGGPCLYSANRATITYLPCSQMQRRLLCGRMKVVGLEVRWESRPRDLETKAVKATQSSVKKSLD